MRKISMNYTKKEIYSIGKSAVRDSVLDKKKRVKGVSIIIPAYNAEKTISTCVDSVRNQKTKYYYRIVIINDASTDNTLEVVQKKYSKEKNIEILNLKSNKGLSGARNEGLKAVETEYVLFLDSDDILPEQAIDSLMTKAEKNNADICEGSYMNFFAERKWCGVVHIDEDYVNPYKQLHGFPWGKIYKTELFDLVKFPEGLWFEDTMLPFLIWSRAKKVSTVKNITYMYRKNPNGISQTSKGNKKSIDTFFITAILLDDMKKLNISMNTDMFEFLLKQVMINDKRLKKLGRNSRKKAFMSICSIIKENFPEYQKEGEKYILRRIIFNSDFFFFKKYMTVHNLFVSSKKLLMLLMMRKKRQRA